MLKLFKNKVAIVSIDEDFKTEIAIGQRQNVSYQLGKVFAAGPADMAQWALMTAAVPEAPTAPSGFAIGDIVLFQLNMIQEQNARFNVYGDKEEPEPVYILNQGDIIAKLKTNVMAIKGFDVINQWALLEPFTVQTGMIEIPDTVELRHTELQRYRLVQCHVLPSSYAGKEVAVERMVVHPIDIDRKRYGFLSFQHIHGVVDTIEPAKVVSITVNARKVHLDSDRLSYEKAVELADTKRKGLHTVTYHCPKGSLWKDEGFIMPGQDVKVVDGTHVTAVVTDQA